MPHRLHIDHAAKFDRRLTLSFGAVVLLLMLTVIGAATALFSQVQVREENRLAGTIAAVLGESLSRVSFSGVYHMRQYTEEITERFSELEYLSVENVNGEVLAHSDPSQIGTVRSEDSAARLHSTAAAGKPFVRSETHGGIRVREVIVPFRGGYDEQVQGFIRAGIRTEDARSERLASLLIILVAIGALTALAMILVQYLSKRFGQTLRDMAWQLQGVLVHAPMAIAITDKEGRIITWSSVFKDRFGLPLRGTPILEHVAPSFSEVSTTEYGRCLSEVADTGTYREWEFSDECPSGSNMWQISIFPVGHSETGGISLCCSIIRDITESKRDERELQRSQAMLARTEHISRVGSWEWDIATDRVTWSDGLFELFGLDPQDGAPSFAQHSLLYSEEDLARLKEIVAKCITDGTPYELELTAKRADGTTFQILTRGYPRRSEAGQVEALYGSVLDITERRSTEAQVQRALTSLNEAERLTHVGSWEIDLGTGRLWWSDEMYRIYGWDATLGPPSNDEWSALMHPDDAEGVRARFQDCILSGEKEAQATFRILRGPEKTERVLHGLARNVFSPDGSVFRQYGVVQDITDQVASDREMAKLQAQLIQSQKMESVGRLAGGVAHDFNNMLQAILGYSDMVLLEVPAGSAAHNDVIEIRKAAEHSVQLTRQLLAFARKQEVSPRILDLNSTVAGMIKMLKRLIGEEVDLEWTPAKELWRVRVDPTQIDQILANLLVNARDAMGEHGRVQIATRNVVLDEEFCSRHAECEAGEYVSLTVSDNGQGMDSETLDHIFEPFYTTKEQGQGTGLGLATVYGIVKQNQGVISVESVVGQGTTFEIYLPRDRTPQPVERQPDRSGSVATGTETVLLVEDEPMILRLGKRLLEDLGYNVLTASSPHEALDLVTRVDVPIDLLITDIVMPEMNGKELSERLREIKPEIRCLYMSGYTANIIADRGVLQEGLGFIQKPFSIVELASKVRGVLED